MTRSWIQQAHTGDGMVAGFSGHHDSDVGAPAVAGYENHKGNIFDTRQGLQDKADGQLSDTRKRVTTATH